jgi:hypothetical protein
MPLNETSGNLTTDAFGGGVAAVPTYIEDVFSTYLYTDSGATQTITNGINLAGKGGLLWVKSRSAVINNLLWDSARGTANYLISNGTNVPESGASVTFNSNGFSVPYILTSVTFVSWTFRKQPKFFDVVTWTGDGTSGRTITSSLFSDVTNACVMVKRIDSMGSWQVFHPGDNTGSQNFLMRLDSTAARETSTAGINANGYVLYNGSGNVKLYSGSTDISNVNASGGTYVAYLFASNAGGFGLTGTDNVISCGSFTSAGASTDVAVNLGYEVQYVLIKPNNVSNWQVYDTMRGLSVTGTRVLYPNTSDAEVDGGSTYALEPSATGFTAKKGLGYASGTQFIYIAIRRGPMKVPTDATKVLQIDVGTNNSVNGIVPTNFAVDASIFSYRTTGGLNGLFNDRLRGYGQTNSAGVTPAMQTSGGDATQGESNYAGSNPFFFKATNSSITRGSNGFNTGGVVSYFFQRAPSFFDEVCYTGTGSYPFTINHNLGVVPELIIFKTRNSVDNWYVYAKPVTSPNANWYQNWASLNSVVQFLSDTSSLTSSPTSTSIPVASYYAASGTTYVAYLFATCAGISKVGSYTGTGATQTIACGFTGGARFVLVKRTDSTGDWYVWDTARGMVSGTDPSLLLNSTAAEVNANSIYTTTGGFQIVSTAAGINASGGTYIFLAIA